MSKPWTDEPNVMIFDPKNLGYSMEELREAARDPDLQERVQARRVLVVLGKPADGRVSMSTACGVVTRLEADPEDSPWGLRLAFDDLDTPAGRAYQDLFKSGGDIKPGLIGVGPPIKIAGFYVEPAA